MKNPHFGNPIKNRTIHNVIGASTLVAALSLAVQQCGVHQQEPIHEQTYSTVSPQIRLSDDTLANKNTLSSTMSTIYIDNGIVHRWDHMSTPMPHMYHHDEVWSYAGRYDSGLVDIYGDVNEGFFRTENQRWQYCTEKNAVVYEKEFHILADPQNALWKVRREPTQDQDLFRKIRLELDAQ